MDQSDVRIFQIIINYIIYNWTRHYIFIYRSPLLIAFRTSRSVGFHPVSNYPMIISYEKSTICRTMELQTIEMKFYFGFQAICLITTKFKYSLFIRKGFFTKTILGIGENMGQVKLGWLKLGYCSWTSKLVENLNVCFGLLLQFFLVFELFNFFQFFWMESVIRI